MRAGILTQTLCSSVHTLFAFPTALLVRPVSTVTGQEYGDTSFQELPTIRQKNTPATGQNISFQGTNFTNVQNLHEEALVPCLIKNVRACCMKSLYTKFPKRSEQQWVLTDLHLSKQEC